MEHKVNGMSLSLADTIFMGADKATGGNASIIPVDIPLTVTINRRYIDDFAFVWLGRVQGRRKGIATIKRLLKCQA